MTRFAGLCAALSLIMVAEVLAGSRSHRRGIKSRHRMHHGGLAGRPMPDLVPGEVWLSDGHLYTGVDNRGSAGGSGTFRCTLDVAGKGTIRSEGDPHPVPITNGRVVVGFPESKVGRLDPTLSGPFTVRVRAAERELDTSNNQFVGRIGKTR